MSHSKEKKNYNFFLNTLCCGIISTVKNANITSVRVRFLNSILQVKETQRKNLLRPFVILIYAKFDHEYSTEVRCLIYMQTLHSYKFGAKVRPSLFLSVTVKL